MAKTVSFFLIGNHLGLVPMVETANKKGAGTAFPYSGESAVKVNSLMKKVELLFKEVRL